MPGTYPPAPPTLSGNLLQVDRMLQSPAYIRRTLRSFTDLRFVADQILTQRLRSSGGAVLYEVSEPILNRRAVESVGAGSNYPQDTPPTGAAALAAVQKWGQDVPVTDEDINRNVYAGDELTRGLRKTVNTVISKVDSLALAAVASTVTATSNVTTPWTATTGTTVLRDIELAVAAIVDLNQGYLPDTILMSTAKLAYMMSDPVISNLLRRETTDNPVYSGVMTTIAGLSIVTSVASNLPNSDVWILDSTQLGGMADEQQDAPGYTVSDMAVEIKSMRDDKKDKWDLRGRRITVPVVREPGAGYRLGNTG